MAYDAFIRIDGIKGDSTDSKHKDWIEVKGFSHELSQAAGGAHSAQGGHAGGRADHGDFQFSKRLDSASPLLHAYCCDAKPIPKIEFEMCRAQGEKICFMKYTFEDSIIAFVSPSGEPSGDDLLPDETVKVRYGKILWEYTPTDPKGGGKKGAAIKSGWDTFENKKI
jgi:type VI secretion system secreted protein Hcp